jgi:hypothetical protein
MLDTAGKVLEELIRRRLTDAIRKQGDLSPKQFGFRSGLCTADTILKVKEAVARAENFSQHSRRVILLVALDVKNAFNSVRWSDIMEALEKNFKVSRYVMRLLDVYLRNRSIIYLTKEGPRKANITAWAAQGSIYGMLFTMTFCTRRCLKNLS